MYTEKHGVNVILCEKIDRLTRNLKDAAIASDWVHEDDQREIHFVKENFVVNQNTKAHDNFIWDMKVAVARFYTNNLSEEVKKGQKEKLAQGWLPTKPPLGYKTVGEKGHKIHVVDEDTAPFVQRMFELYATGEYSLMALGKQLQEEGLRTRTGSALVKSRLHDLLCDPFYYGAMRWKDVVYERGAHQPLISKDLYDRVHQVLNGGQTPHMSKKTFQFRKLFKCSECGGTITGEIQKGHVYYHCNHYRKCSQKKYTREELMEEKLLGVFKFLENMTQAEADEIKTRIRANHAQEAEYKENQVKTLSARYAAAQRRIDNLYEDRLDERISSEFWEQKHKELNTEREAIREQLEKMQTEEAKYFEIWLHIIDLAHRAREIYERRSPEEKRMLLRYLFSNLTLSDEDVAYTFTPAMDIVAKRVQERLDAESDFRTTKKRVSKRRKDSFESLHPALLHMLNEVRTCLYSS